MSFDQTTLGSFAKVQGGYAYKSQDFSKAGNCSVLKIKNIRFGYVDYSETAFINDDLAGETIDWRTAEGDVLISMTGSGPNAPKSLVGRTARVWKNDPTSWINQRVGRIVIKEEKSIHLDYVFYLLTSPQSQEFLVSNSSGSANQANISGKTIEALPCPNVSFSESARIAKILRNLDEKIILNRRINQTLEEMAQAIFKSWFVDFDPTRAKITVLEAGGTAEDAERAAMRAISGKSDDELSEFEATSPDAFNTLKSTAALFPAALQDSELGEIPQGWEVSEVGSVSKCFDKKRVPLSKRQREQRQGTIPYYGATSVMDFVDQPIFDGIYLLLGEDGSVLKEDGSPFIQYIWGKSWVNNHAHVLQGLNGISTEQLMVFMSLQNITAYITGAVQLKLNQKNMNSIPFIKATGEINRRYNEIISSYYEIIRNISDENKALVETRDTLLPKLLSGEIDLSNITSSNDEVA